MCNTKSNLKPQSYSQYVYTYLVNIIDCDVAKPASLFILCGNHQVQTHRCMNSVT